MTVRVDLIASPHELLPSQVSVKIETVVEELGLELNRLSQENAERLTVILRGLHACMADMNERLERMEKSDPCGLRREF